VGQVDQVDPTQHQRQEGNGELTHWSIASDSCSSNYSKLRRREGDGGIPDPALLDHFGGDELWCPEDPPIVIFCAREVIPGEGADGEGVEVFWENLNCCWSGIAEQHLGDIEWRGGQCWRRGSSSGDGTEKGTHHHEGMPQSQGSGHGYQHYQVAV
jgi:hypothetical protein